MNESVNEVVANASPQGPRNPDSQLAALVVDDALNIRDFMRFALARRCSFVEVAASIHEADALRRRCHFDVLIIDIRMPDRSGLDWARALRHAGVRTPMVLMSAYPEDIDSHEAADLPEVCFVSKPFSLDQILAAVEYCLDASAAPLEALPAKPGGGLEGIVSHSEAMRSLMGLIRRVASRNTTVLLEGESGTGKEVAARCLHRFSGRRGPFVPVNCGSIAPELLESELFGHTKGAFTGATQAREGLFVHASRGTLFLDEICEMPLAMQSKLLRVLEERVIRPVGSERERPVDVRIVTATNRDMAEEVAQSRFREDLYYRLNVLGLRLPPLRERPSDIPHLARLFADNLAEELGLPPLQFTRADIERLSQHQWPGNVRELKNLIERAMLLNQTPSECLGQEQLDAPGFLGAEGSEFGFPTDMSLEEVERLHIRKVLGAAGGNKSEAARRLGVSRKTLERKVKAWNQAEQ
ncbi:sigma-54 dependent transcriptional regulator [Aquisalimonas sp.]|uniref:sigma-54-dependent transcriptional regulator n=1 Tax=Aquisalimonas sp. TaxID=1872621 RepID=UPI0025C0F1C9|nr:sigma-54 dependent transcriptional regulator [Aquisalimonas sp.]